MLIDWFTVVAQMINFFILVWLLKRFLYKPILTAIDSREKRIAEEIAGADMKKLDAQKECDTYTQKNREFDQQRSTLMSKATEDAQVEGRRLLDEAQNEASVLRLRQQETLNNEKQAFYKMVGSRVQQEVFALSQKALTDLADADLEERIVAIFVRRLCELTEDDKHLLTSTLQGSLTPAVVHTSCELTPSQRGSIEDAVKVNLGAEIPVTFVTTPNLICGIELYSNGQKVAWSIADYLTSLENSVDKIPAPDQKNEILQLEVTKS